ncbi:MAG: PAS domain S-box protein, partial [Bacteroidales bacterium]|nr:PAS domain S-box protein [Bacteroidales bacterium]
MKNLKNKTKEQLIEEVKTLQKENEKKLKTIFHAAENVSFILTDMAGEQAIIREFSPGAEKIFGYKKEEVLGKPVAILHLPEDVKMLPEILKAMSENKQGFKGESTLVRKSGERFPAMFTTFPIFDDNGAMTGSTCVSIDITELKGAEELLHENERRFMEMANLLPQIVYETDMYGNLTFVNKQAFKSFGYSKEEYEKGINVLQTLIPEERDRAKENIRNVLYGKDIGNPEYAALRKDGSTFPIMIYSSVILKDNKPVGLRGIIVDITKRKQVEESFKRFNRIIEDSLNEIILFDADTLKFTEVNIAAQQNLGYTMDEFQKLTPLDINPEFTAESFAKLVEPLRKGKTKKIVFETVHKRKNQSLYHVEVHLQLLNYESKTLFVAIILDITERKQTEEKIKASEGHFRALIENSSDVISILDEKGNVTYESPSHKSVLGYKHGELIGRNVFEYVHPDDRERIMLQFAGLLPKPGDIEKVNFRFKHKDGYWLYIEGAGRNLLLSPEVKGIVVNYRNVTKSKLAEEKIKELAELEKKKTQELEESLKQLQISQDASLNMLDDLNKEIDERVKVEKELKNHQDHLEENVQKRTIDLEKSQISLAFLLEDVNEAREELGESNLKLELANKDLEAFAYSISHDLRAPLRHIDGFTRMLKSSIKIESPESERYFQKISESSKSMASMIDGLLNFSRLGRKSLQKSPVNLNEIVDKVIRQFKQDTKGRDIEWKVGKLPVINVDEKLMTLALENLVSNAIKFTSKKENARIDITTCLKGKRNCSFYIKDNGVGFDMGYANNLFGVFQRLHTKEEFDGTGIGLANVKQI